MENASRALLMAAGILISVMIISFGTFIFSVFKDYTEQMNSNLSQAEINKFNNQFTKYEDTDCNVYDIVSIINLAKDSNNKYDEYQNLSFRPNNYASTKNMYIYVTVDGNDIGKCPNELSSQDELNSFITNNDNNKQVTVVDSNGETSIDYQKKFNCTIQVSNDTALVKSIKFTLKK